MKVNFLVAGTQKGGTTALAQFLSEHPQICMADRNEVHFFDDDRFFATWPPDYAAYHRHFACAADCKAVGEATPRYMYWETASARIREYNPDMKLIFVLRNPMERAYSHYKKQRRKRRLERLPFLAALHLEEWRQKRVLPKQNERYAYVDRGFYSRQIKRMLGDFPREQMLFFKTEDLRENHDDTLCRIHNFLGVEPRTDTRHREINAHEYRDMSRAAKRFLWEKFRAEIDELEELLGWDCSSWRPRL